MSMPIINYWNMKDSEVLQLALDRKIIASQDDYDRKTVINALKAQDEIGAADTAMLDDGDGPKPLEEDVPCTTVIFHNTGINDTPYVPVGHNGRAWYLPKDKEIRVPNFILDSCIKDAVEEHEEQVVHPNGRITYDKRKIQRFPYSIVR